MSSITKGTTGHCQSVSNACYTKYAYDLDKDLGSVRAVNKVKQSIECAVQYSYEKLSYGQQH